MSYICSKTELNKNITEIHTTRSCPCSNWPPNNQIDPLWGVGPTLETLTNRIQCTSCKEEKTGIVFGWSSCPLYVCLREHTSSVVKNNLICTLAVHAVDNGHSILFEGTTIVDSEKVTWKRKYKEGIYIYIYIYTCMLTVTVNVSTVPIFLETVTAETSAA